MIAKETLTVTLSNKFSMRERFKILFGFQVITQAQVEVTAKGNLKHKEIKITHAMGKTQTFLGKPEKRAQ